MTSRRPSTNRSAPSRNWSKAAKRWVCAADTGGRHCEDYGDDAISARRRGGMSLRGAQRRSNLGETARDCFAALAMTDRKPGRHEMNIHEYQAKELLAKFGVA